MIGRLVLGIFALAVLSNGLGCGPATHNTLNVRRPPPPFDKTKPTTYANVSAMILGPRCDTCHAPGSPSTASGLPFTDLSAMVNDKNGRWNAPAKSGRVLRALTRRDKFTMPPANSGPPLSDDEVDFIARWIDSGLPQ